MPPSTPATQRIQALSQQLSTSPNPTQTANTMATEKKPPITCHVLDTSIGKPAPSIPVTLTLLSNTSESTSTTPSTPPSFTGTTNADGRITSWTPSASAPFTSPTDLATLFAQPGDQKWSLTFDTEEYFGSRGVDTFFPECVVRFVIREKQKGEHFHVPVLVGRVWVVDVSGVVGGWMGKGMHDGVVAEDGVEGGGVREFV